MTEAGAESEIVQLDQHVPFTMVENNIISSINDYVALGLYLDMRSRPRGWRFNLATMARTKKQGRDALSSAMKQLIERGLVFRVKFQRPTGQWATRIYVAQRPVTAAELLDVRASYSGRCSIVTSADLTTAANPARTAPVDSSDSQPPRTTPMTAQADETTGIDEESTQARDTRAEPRLHPAKLLVGPTDGNPSVGNPVFGEPTSRQPPVSDPTISSPSHGGAAANYQESRKHLPPPTPSSDDAVPSQTVPSQTVPAQLVEPRSVPLGRVEVEEDGVSNPLTRGPAIPEPLSPPTAAGERSAETTPHAPGINFHREGDEHVRPAGVNDTIGDSTAADEQRETSAPGPVDDVLAAVTRVWTRLGRHDVRRLSAAVQEVLDVGIPASVLSEHLTANPDGVRSPIHVLLARCANHPAPPASAPDLLITAWCGECLDPHHRWVEVGPTRVPTPCPRCNTAANARSRTRGPAAGHGDGKESHIRELIATTRRNLQRPRPTT